MAVTVRSVSVQNSLPRGKQWEPRCLQSSEARLAKALSKHHAQAAGRWVRDGQWTRKIFAITNS